MYLDKLYILNFKNYQEAELKLSQKFNCFLGKNGGGKTNLLDAIHYLAFCKSFFNPIDQQLINHEEAYMVLQAEFMRKDEVEKIYCGLKKGEKKQFKRNKKVYERLSDHIGLIPIVMISPADSQLISEGSESRRRFMDMIISQFDKRYLENLIKYNRAVNQRNRLLKKFMETRRFDETSLEVWDEQLMQYGNMIHKVRNAFIKDFIPLFQAHYDNISLKNEKVELIFDSQLNETPFDELLLQSRDRDRRLTYSSTGIHKDDLHFMIEGKQIKRFGSQGQQKTFLLSLKLAQSEYLKNKMDITPILLLDDIYDKLDYGRIEQLMAVVQSDWFGQVFITDTDEDRLPKLFDQMNMKYKAFTIKDGEAHEQ